MVVVKAIKQSSWKWHGPAWRPALLLIRCARGRYVGGAPGKIDSFIQNIRRRPQVMDVYFLAGADDFILHVAARDTDDLRSFVVQNLNADADVAGTQTSLIFEPLRGASPL